MVFAFAVPALSLAVLGGIDFTCAAVDRSKMQEVADQAALSGAKQLLVDTSSATARRAQSFARPQLGSLIDNWTLNVGAQVVGGGNAVKVTITGNRPARLLGMIPADGWNVGVSATAQVAGKTPLCVLATGSNVGGLLGIGGTTAVIDLKSRSRVTAQACMVQSNQNIAVGSSARVTAGLVQAVGQASGMISPTPQTGAPAIPDPFASINVNIPSLCTDLNLRLISGTQTLAPGVHCGVIMVGNSATLTLAPGEHYFFAATLSLTGHAVLAGTDVALIFDATSSFMFTNNSDIELEGRKSGPLAGFVIIAARDNTKTFTISTTSAHKLLGVVYVPNGLLSISGANRVAETSDWTVIVAKGIAMDGSANLTVNANYVSTTVPVPAGVGPASSVRLTN